MKRKYGNSWIASLSICEYLGNKNEEILLFTFFYSLFNYQINKYWKKEEKIPRQSTKWTVSINNFIHSDSFGIETVLILLFSPTSSLLNKEDTFFHSSKLKKKISCTFELKIYFKGV